MSGPAEKDLSQNARNAIPGGVTPEVAVEDGTGALVRYGDAANKAVRVNVVAGGSGGGTVDQGASGDPADPWNVDVTEDGTDTPVKPGDATRKAIRSFVVEQEPGTGDDNLGKRVGDAVGAAPVGVVLLGKNPSPDPGTWVPLSLRGDGTVDVHVSTVDSVVTTQQQGVAVGPTTFDAPGVGADLTSPARAISLQVDADGLVTAWDIRLEVSLNGGVTWGEALRHTQADGTGIVKTAVFAGPQWRLRCDSITLGPGVSVTANGYTI